MNLESAMNQTQDNTKPRPQHVFLLVLTVLLILRIPFLAGMRFFDIQWEWTDTIFDIGTYALTTFLIWWEVDNLAEYHIDTIAVIVIILFKPIQTLILKYWGYNDLPLTFPSVSSLIIWFIAIVFAMAIWWKRSKLPSIKSSNLAWVLIGLGAGLLTSIFLSLPISFQIPKTELSYAQSIRSATRDILVGIPVGLFYQTGYAAVAEEPLFRGFLWGYLRKLKWREHWIWLFQAGLFTFSHIYNINTYPISFWIVIPICALVFGWLAWRSRTIASSMAAHGMINATARAFGYLLALYRLG